MYNYDDILNDLLKKYGLYKEFKLNIIEIINEILEKNTSVKKKYLLCADINTLLFWQSNFKLTQKVNFKYIALECLEHKYDKLYEIEIVSLDDIDENCFDEILVCSYNNQVDIEYLRKKFINKKIVNIYDYIPQYIKGFRYEFFGNIIYNYINKKQLLISQDKKESLIEEIERFNKTILYNCNEEKIINAKTIIWGGGIHSINLLKNTDIINMLNVKYIVDKNEKLIGKKINGIEIISFEKLKDVDFNTFFISSYEFRKEIKEEIEEKFSNINVVDIYRDDNKYEIITRVILENKNINDIQRSNIVKDIIIAYLAIRDFYNAEKYISEYIKNKYMDYKLLNEFLDKLKDLLKEMKYTVNKMNKPNIHFIIIDAIDKYAFDKYMINIKSKFKNCIEYENAFCASTYTTESHLCMFIGENLFDKKTYVREIVSKDKSRFINGIEKRGYSICGNNIREITKGCFDKQIGDDNTNNPISKILWENLCYRIKSGDTNKFIYSRAMEYHDLVYNVEAETVKYIDEQLVYYLNFVNKNDYIIITSDHGRGIIESGERRIKVPVLIKTPNNKNILKKNLFSMKNIGDEIIKILDNDYTEEKNEYIKVERTKIYNKSLKITYLISNKERKKYVQAFRVIRTNEEKYIIFEDGTEEFYLINDEAKNLINDSKYLKKVEKMRKLSEKQCFPK